MSLYLKQKNQRFAGLIDSANIISKKQWRALKSGGSIKVSEKDAKELERLSATLFSIENDIGSPVTGFKVVSVSEKDGKKLK